MARLFAAAVILVAVPVLASEPGQPLDCSDWVFLVPGLHCEYASPWPCQDALPTSECVVSTASHAISNDSYQLAVRAVALPTECPLSVHTFPMTRIELVRFDGISTQLLGYLSDRCNSPSNMDQVEVFDGFGYSFFNSNPILFDAVRGSLWTTTEVWCQGDGGGCPYQTDCQTAGCIAPLRVFRITGLTPLYEVQESYDPSMSNFGFRVPALPEGLDAVDHFDTYWATWPTRSTSPRRTRSSATTRPRRRTLGTT